LIARSFILAFAHYQSHSNNRYRMALIDDDASDDSEAEMLALAELQEHGLF
jgi:hypothetical protein